MSLADTMHLLSTFYLACAIVAMLAAGWCLLRIDRDEIAENRIGMTQVGLLFAIFCLLMAKL